MIKKGRIVSHPGLIVKDAIDALDLSQSEFAYRSGLSIKNVSTLINGESNITFDVAIKLSAFFGNSIEGWINLQTNYDLYLNREEKYKKYKEDWLIAKTFDKEFFLKFLGLNIDKCNKEETIDNLRRTLNVAYLSNLKHADMYAFCKTSVIKDIDEKSIILRNAWITLAEKEAKKITCPSFNKERIIKNIPYLRSLTLKGSKAISKDLKQFLLTCGIKLVILPFLKGSNISGVTKWIANENCVMVAINDYGKDADKIWFSIYHEIGHTIKNHKRHLTISFNKNNILDKDEIEANEFAKKAFIDEEEYQTFINNKDFSPISIKQFASKQNVADFMVVGRLQKDGIVFWNQLKELKPKYTITF